MKIAKRMKKALDFLGEPYRVKTIDFEQCLYKDLNNGYDIEVSGVNRQRRGLICTFIQVWDMRGGARTVEKVEGVKTLSELKAVLDLLSEKYGDRKVDHKHED